MIISPTHKFVYIGIPRTASKSMNEWLMRHYGGIWYGGHHDYEGIPDDARSFLVFTTVRNPYDRAVSGFFLPAVGCSSATTPDLIATARHWSAPLKTADAKILEPEVMSGP